MFAADLSWQKGESVGEHKERKAREQSSGETPSIRTSVTSRSSSSTDRQQRWTSGLKKATAKISSKSSKARTVMSPKLSSQQRSDKLPLQSAHKSVPEDFSSWELELPHHLKESSPQPTYTFLKSSSPRLPSGSTIDALECDVPELEGDISSRYTHSIVSVSSHDHHWEVKTPQTEALSGVEELHGCDPYSLASVNTRTSTGSHEQQDSTTVPRADVLRREKWRTIVPQTETRVDQDSYPQEAATTDGVKQSGWDTKTLTCRPMAQWDSLSPMMVPKDLRKLSASRSTKVAITQKDPYFRTRFQCFIQILESAEPHIVLDKLKETLQEPASQEAEEDLLEQQLWLLTGFQLQILSKAQIVPKPQCHTGKILELYGNLSEVYQSSAMHPDQIVHFLTTKPQRTVSLPGNVSYLTIREFGTVPLPYPEGYFSHIRASTLPSLVPSAKLPELFRECYKLLAPGGLLEIRIIDAAPVRKTAGPLMRMWIDDRLSVNLEKLFRCSKPCSLVPGWLTEAGFKLSAENDQTLALPCAFDQNSDDIGKELSAMIGQALWKDTWGPFVDDILDEPRWWWEEETIMQECLKRKTVLDCRSLFAYKR